DGFDLGHIFENLKSDGALAGDDLFVVVRRHDDVAVLGGQFFGFELAFGAAGTYQYNVRAQGGSCLALDGGGVVGHDDDGLHAERAGRVGDALGVIAAGVGDDAAF